MSIGQKACNTRPIKITFYNLKAKKSYGQHFLNSESVAKRIAQSLQLTDTYPCVLEVGPGKGMLTRFLVDEGYDLSLVEADPDMVDHLREHFPDLRDDILLANFLKVDLNEAYQGRAFGLIGNFPYNISSQILFHMLEYREQIPEMVGMFQREVAERVVAGPGSKTYGVISVLIQAYYSGEYLFGVDSKKFNPPPKVQSAVIRLTRLPDQTLGCDESLFKHVVKTAFSQRRKMLRNTMKSFLKDDPILKEPFFQNRPERLSVADFVELTRTIEKKR